MWSSRTRRTRALSRELALLLTSVLAFVALTIWWLTQDNRVQDWDNGLHTIDAFLIRQQLSAGDLTTWFTEFNTYPPFGHLIGALGTFVGGFSAASVIIASKPRVRASAGRWVLRGRPARVRVEGRRAPRSAVRVGTPMIVSEFHEFLLDPQQAALIAVSVWAILGSRRLERTGVAAVAGALSALAMLTKQTSVIFLAGPVAVVVLRGGWRNWRGILAFAAPLAVLAGPWLVYHRHELSALVSIHDGAAGSSAANEAGSFFPPRLSRKSFGWYFWSTLNIELLAPLMLATLIGTVIAIRDSVRRFSPENLRPEVLGGLFVSWLGMTLITHKDPRYLLPALVYMAVLGTGWIATATRFRGLLTAGLAAVVAINVLGVTIGLGSALRLSVPGARGVGAHRASSDLLLARWLGARRPGA